MGGRRHFPKTSRASTRVVAKTHGRAKTLPEDRSGEHAHQRHVRATSSDDSRNRKKQCVLHCRKVLCFAAKCKQFHATCHDGTATRFDRPQACPRTTSTRNPCGVPPCARANPTVMTEVSQTCRRKASTCVASPQAVSKRGAARSCVAPVAHVASGNHVESADVASKRGITCSCDVREPAGIARCGVREQGGVACLARCGVKTSGC